MLNRRIFLTASLITTLGSALTNIALTYRYLLDRPGCLSFGLILYSATLASVVSGPLIGYWVDKRRDGAQRLPAVNFLLAALTVGFVLIDHLYLAAAVVFVHTIFSVYESALLFQLLPRIIGGDELKRTNASLEQINSIGFIFAPMVAPLISMMAFGDRALFILDAISFLIAGLAYQKLFSGLKELDRGAATGKNSAGKGTETKATAHSFWKGFIASFGDFLSESKMKPFLMSLILYLFGFSAMAYSLAVIAKRATAGSAMLYALPILAMFGGRIISLAVIEKIAFFRRLDAPFLVGLVGAGIFMMPLGHVQSLGSLCALEFALGWFIAMAKYGERNFMQLSLGAAHHGKLGALRQSLQMATKLASVPLISFLIWSGHEQWTTLFLGSSYLAAAVLFARFVMNRGRSHRKTGQNPESLIGAQRNFA